MKTKFTPGPYSISGIPGDSHIMARVGHERETVAVVTGWFEITPEEHEANKTLLASAPALLEALETTLNAISNEKALQARRGQSVAVELGLAENLILKTIAAAIGERV